MIESAEGLIFVYGPAISLVLSILLLLDGLFAYTFSLSFSGIAGWALGSQVRRMITALHPVSRQREKKKER